MAPVYKCTKITNTGDSLLVTGAYQIKVDYTNPTTSPPTPGSVTIQVPYADAEDPIEIQNQANALLIFLGSDAIDWDL